MPVALCLASYRTASTTNIPHVRCLEDSHTHIHTNVLPSRLLKGQCHRAVVQRVIALPGTYNLCRVTTTATAAICHVGAVWQTSAELRAAPKGSQMSAVQERDEQNPPCCIRVLCELCTWLFRELLCRDLHIEHTEKQSVCMVVLEPRVSTIYLRDECLPKYMN